METKRSFFDEFFEIIGWIRIFLSPFLASLIIAAIVYFGADFMYKNYIAIVIIFIGIIVGIAFANTIYKTQKGTIHFLSRGNSTKSKDSEDQ